MKSGTIFDNILITDDETKAEEVGEETWGATKDPEKTMKDGQDEEERKQREAEEAARKDEEGDEEEEEMDMEEPEVGFVTIKLFLIFMQILFHITQSQILSLCYPMLVRCCISYHHYILVFHTVFNKCFCLSFSG